MGKEVLLYGDIYSYSAMDIISQLNEVGSNDLVLRVNSDGGEVRYGWGILAKIQEMKGKKLFKNDGEANSMSAYAFCYNDNNEAIDTATFMFHRASYGRYEQSEFFTDADRAELVEKNKKLRSALESKINVEAFSKITGVTLDAIFSMDQQIGVTITAEQAKECNLIDRVIKITPDITQDIQAKKAAITALYSKQNIAAEIAAQNNPQNTTMTVDEIKAKYPEAYKAIYAKGKARGIEVELDRVGSILAYIDADQKGVLEAIKTGKPLSQTQHAEFSLKAVTALAAKNMEEEGQPPIITAKDQKPPVTAKDKELEGFKDEVFSKLNIKKAA